MQDSVYYLNFARVGDFHLQAEPLSVIKLDALSREAGAFKAEAIPLIAGCPGLNNAADGSLRLARPVGSSCPVVARRAKSEAESEAQRVKSNEIK